MCQDAFALEEGESSNQEVTTTANAQLFLLLFATAQSSAPSNRTMQFKGPLQGHDILILVNSGSSHSFLSSTVASTVQGLHQLDSPVSVQVADGGSISCYQELSMAVWSVQGYEFHSNLKVLPLGSYDMIIGMDWLDAFSPMKVHWAQKWMMIPYGSMTTASRPS